MILYMTTKESKTLEYGKWTHNKKENSYCINYDEHDNTKVFTVYYSDEKVISIYAYDNKQLKYGDKFSFNLKDGTIWYCKSFDGGGEINR